jgi:hypothetical protein
MSDDKDLFSAGEQSLGYGYQPRFALLQLLKLPEETGVLIEKDDDIQFIETDGQMLASLKHKAPGDRLTDLSRDFWKSVRIWLTRYNRDSRIGCSLRFFLFTTAAISEQSFLTNFASGASVESPVLRSLADEALARSESTTILAIKSDYDNLTEEEKEDFLARITIVDNTPRIEDVPELIMDQHMRTVRREFRSPVYERLEGWWNDQTIRLMTGMRTSEISGYEVSDKLSAISDQYKTDNLPIDFRGKYPESEIDPEDDPRLFVAQLKEIQISPGRIESAILDYYRAFEQRSSWARENVLVEGEVEEYEDRLIDEWGRYRDVVFETINENSAEGVMQEAGRELYKWAEFNTDHLRIRERVSEPYVVRGNYHILANNQPLPRVYWHPRFLERLEEILTKNVP